MQRLIVKRSISVTTPSPRAKVTIESLQEVAYEKSINTKINDLDLCLEIVSLRYI